ncbi:hypothetical protein vseg_013726 [Gypsophila vaccaria]
MAVRLDRRYFEGARAVQLLARDERVEVVRRTLSLSWVNKVQCQINEIAFSTYKCHSHFRGSMLEHEEYRGCVFRQGVCRSLEIVCSYCIIFPYVSTEGFGEIG